MLVATGPGPWPDTADPAVRWAFPAGLAVRADPEPRFLVSRWRDADAGAAGGFVHLELSTVPAEGARTVPLAAARVRVRLRGLATDRTVLDWREVPPAADPLVDLTERLDPDEAQLLVAALTGGGTAVDVELEAVADGVVTGLPVLATVHPGRLPTDESTVDEIAAALLSEPAAVDLRALDDRPVDRAAALAELAPRLAGDVLAPVGGRDAWTEPRYRFLGWPGPDPAYDLRTPRPQRVRWATTWSASDFLAGRPAGERAALVPELAGTAGFQQLPVVVVCPVPVDPVAGIRRVQVDVTAPGPGGLPERRSFGFDGGPVVRRFTAAFPAWLPAPAVTATATATLAAGPGADPPWPRVRPPVPVPVEGGLVAVTAERLGLGTVAVTADPSVFAVVGALPVAVGTGAGATLTAEAPTATLAFPADPGAVLSIAGLKDRPVPAAVTVTAADLEDLDPPEVTVELTLDLPYAAVTLADPTGRSRTLTLERGTPVRWPCHRRTALDPLSYRWQLLYVARGPDGSTAPLRATDWAGATTDHLTISATGA
jgi:hypothetical protein